MASFRFLLRARKPTGGKWISNAPQRSRGREPLHDGSCHGKIIQVRPPSPTEFSSDAAKRRDVIEKISIRSNLQNPIKKWNLISNDLYQHDLARFFRKKKLYYERRDGEWAGRRTELKSVGIRRGPHIKALTQLIASYHWDNKHLGPGVARGGLRELFEEKPYAMIELTQPEVVFQIYLLGQTIDECVKDIALSRKYVEELASYVRLGLFALSVKAFEASGATFGSTEMRTLLERRDLVPRGWLMFCKSGVDLMHVEYRKAAKRYRSKTGKQLTIANFSKAKEYVGNLLERPLPSPFRKLARQLLRSS